MVAVQQDGRRSRSTEPIAVHVRMDAIDLEDVHVREADFLQKLRERLRRPPHLGGRKSLGGYARNAYDLDQPLLEVVEIAIDGAKDVLHFFLRKYS